MVAVCFLNHRTVSDSYLSALHVTSLAIIFYELSILVVHRLGARGSSPKAADTRTLGLAAIATALGRFHLEVISCVGLQVVNPHTVGFGAVIRRLRRMGEIVLLGSVPNSPIRRRRLITAPKPTVCEIGRAHV